MYQFYLHSNDSVFSWDLLFFLFCIVIGCLIGLCIFIKKLFQHRDELADKITTLEHDLDLAKSKLLHLTKEMQVVDDKLRGPDIFKLDASASGPFQNNKENSPSTNVILIIDDDSTSRELAGRMLENAGWKVKEVETGYQAFTYLEQCTQLPALILLDLMLPDLDGFAVLSTFQKNHEWSGIPVIVNTAKDITQEERRLLYDSTLAILRKGAYTQKELIETISKQFSGKGSTL